MSTTTSNGLNGNSHYLEINQHYAEECSQDDIGSFLFTSESVGEGHPGTMNQYLTPFYSHLTGVFVASWLPRAHGFVYMMYKLACFFLGFRHVQTSVIIKYQLSFFYCLRGLFRNELVS